MATLLFLDDSQQRKCGRPRTGPLVAVGGICIADAAAADLDRELDELCSATGFPRGEFFKWSPGKGHWMRENLQGDARQEFYRTVLEIVAKHGGVAQVVISDTSRGTARHADHQFDVLLLSLERFHLELPADETGIVVVARPSGGRADEDTFLSGCADLVAEGSDYLKFNRLVMNIVTMPMQNSRILQAADLVVSITTAMVAGHQQFSEPLFPAVKAVLRNADGRYGGIGVKLHPDFVYVNLYHWLLGDTYYRRGSTGIELPMTNRPFRESADVF